MANAWIQHVKLYATEHKMTYKQALKEARATYQPMEKKTKKKQTKQENVVPSVPVPQTKKKQTTKKKQQTTEQEVIVPSPSIDVPTPPVETPTETTTTTEPQPQPRFKFGFRQPGLFPPKSRKLIEEVGKEKVQSLRLERAPILTWLNFATFGKYKKILSGLGYDQMYHLSIVINDKYRMEKNQVLNFERYKKQKKVQTLDVPIPPEYDATIDDLINATRDYMGPERFSRYNVGSENCQKFINSVLTANHLMNPELEKFVDQDVEAVLKQAPGSKTIITKITDLAAKINRLIEGEGVKGGLKGVLLKFSSTEMSQLENVYYSKGKYDGYDVVQVQFYYPENIAIGGIGKVGWKQFPRSPLLGYHLHDVEWIAIYYKDNTPVKVVMSCHGLRENNIYTWDEVAKEDGYLVVYVARNSHGNYKDAKVHKRVKGLANDITSNDGEQIKIRWDEMEPARDINYEGCCRVYKGIRPQPTEPTMTQDERWKIDRKNGYI